MIDLSIAPPQQTERRQPPTRPPWEPVQHTNGNARRVDAQTIAEALGGKRSGNEYVACCPAHDDHDPSLSINDGDNGKPVVFCHVGCSQDAVIAALSEKGLWPESNSVLSREKLEAMKAESAKCRKDREAKERQAQGQAAVKARQRWEAARQANQTHPYLATKHIKPHGIRQEGEKLLIPLRDESSQIWALQTIDPAGGKLFSPGGCLTKGLYFSIGQPTQTSPVCIVEGFATGAAIHEATGFPVACAMTAGSLETVARIIKAKLPDNRVMLCADNDQKPGTDQNPGIEAATRAALAIGGLVATPDLGGRKCDWWDVWHEKGADVVRQAIEAAAPVGDQQEAPAGDQETALPARIRPIGIHDFLTLDFPPRHNLLSPWLPSQGLAMVYAARGIGKTHFALGVAYAVACGGHFLNWQAPEPVGVLYVDGEMPGAVMQERLSAIAASNELEPSAPFMLVTPDLQPEGMPRIDTPEGQDKIDSILSPAIKLIVIDNISTLTQTKENEADGWTPVQAWALRQRAAGRSVLFVHHAGKGGQQRGTSRREDVLDTVLNLRRPVDYCPDQGAVFEVHFEKARGIYGEDVKPIEARLITTDAGLNTWATRTVEAGTFDRVVQMLNEGLKQQEIVAELGLNKSTVSRHAKRAKADGLVVTA